MPKEFIPMVGWIMSFDEMEVLWVERKRLVILDDISGWFHGLLLCGDCKQPLMWFYYGSRARKYRYLCPECCEGSERPGRCFNRQLYDARAKCPYRWCPYVDQLKYLGKHIFNCKYGSEKQRSKKILAERLKLKQKFDKYHPELSAETDIPDEKKEKETEVETQTETPGVFRRMMDSMNRAFSSLFRRRSPFQRASMNRVEPSDYSMLNQTGQSDSFQTDRRDRSDYLMMHRLDRPDHSMTDQMDRPDHSMTDQMDRSDHSMTDQMDHSMTNPMQPVDRTAKEAMNLSDEVKMLQRELDLIAGESVFKRRERRKLRTFLSPAPDVDASALKRVEIKAEAAEVNLGFEDDTLEEIARVPIHHWIPM